MDVQGILEFLEWLANWLWGQWQVQWLVGQIAVNVLAAALVGVVTGSFAWARLWEFLYKKVLPLVAVYGAFSFVGETIDMAWVADVTWGLLAVRLGTELLDNLKKLGVEKSLRPLAAIPDALTKERLP